MQKTFRDSSPFPTRRSVIWASAIVSAAALVAAGGCSSGELEPIGGAGAVAGTGITTAAGTGNFAGSSSVVGGGTGNGTSGSVGSMGGTGAVTTSGGTSGNAPVAGSGGAAVAGGGGVSSSGGTGGAAPKPCVDVEPPPDPEWPGATCESWATETSECTASWFAPYCDVSCKRCVPEGGGAGGGSAGGPAAVDCSSMNLPQVSGGNGYATRYWDCCQTHCSQFDGHRCNQDGTSRTGNTQSSCSGGGSFACYDEAPKAVNDCLSYGYVAKSNPNCGQCYRIEFTGQGQYNDNDPGSKLIKGKQMIVKVSNTGGDVAGNQFDLMIPGGGVGQFNACSKQWGTSDLGAQYGGFLTNCTGAHAAKKECVRTNCMKIPAGPARDGCLWFVDWLQAADNPKFTSQQTDCPF